MQINKGVLVIIGHVVVLHFLNGSYAFSRFFNIAKSAFCRKSYMQTNLYSHCFPSLFGREHRQQIPFYSRSQ